MYNPPPVTLSHDTVFQIEISFKYQEHWNQLKKDGTFLWYNAILIKRYPYWSDIISVYYHFSVRHTLNCSSKILQKRIIFKLSYGDSLEEVYATQFRNTHFYQCQKFYFSTSHMLLFVTICNTDAFVLSYSNN